MFALLAHLLAVAQLTNASDVTLYLRTGGVDVGLVAMIVEGMVEGLFKPFIDKWFNPVTDTRHDPAMEIIILVLTVAGVLVAQGVGPIGLHDATSYVAVAIQAMLALFTEWGIYLKLRGPVPVTPTEKFQASLAGHPRLTLLAPTTSVPHRTTHSTPATKPPVAK